MTGLSPGCLSPGDTRFLRGVYFREEMETMIGAETAAKRPQETGEEIPHRGAFFQDPRRSRLGTEARGDDHAANQRGLALQPGMPPLSSRSRAPSQGDDVLGNGAGGDPVCRTGRFPRSSTSPAEPRNCTPACFPMIENLAPLTRRIMLRCNLTLLAEEKRDDLLEVCRTHRVVLVASFPSLNASQTEAQRGQGVFLKSLATLKRLNEMGYGRPGSDLELNLVSNPVGAFLPVSQAQAEKRFRQELREKWKIEFHQLFTFANVPLGRFRRWLEETGNLEAYLRKLASGFNPCTLESVMCRTLVSVGWDGYLYDCDFNLAKGIYLGGRKRHVSEMTGPPQPGEPIATSDHCYACTAGSGFT